MSGNLGNSYNIDIWGLLIALGMVAVAAIISELMHMGIGKTLMWSSCRALVQLCAMGFIIGYVIRSNSVWMVFALMAVMLVAAVQIVMSRARGIPKGLAGPIFLSLVITMLLGNTVTALAVGLSRFYESMEERRDEVDMMLALGATPWESARPSIVSSIRLGLLPTTASLASSGIVTIPGMMAGQVIAGGDPLNAAKYQFVVLDAIAALTLLLALPACRADTGVGRTLRVGVALYQQEDTFIETVTRELQRAALETGDGQDIKINLYIADGKESQATQNEQVDRFLERGYDVICVNVVDRTAAAVIIDKAQAADVPVIFFNREPVEEDLRRWQHAYYIGLPAGDAGVLQGELVLDAWQSRRNELDRNGDGVLQYVMLEGEPGHQDALLRTEYSISTLIKAGVSTEKLASAAANWQRGQAGIRMRQWLREFGEEIEAVFANNDDMALGAIDACTEAGLDKSSLPFIVGVDATPPAMEALREGTLKGTVRNDAVGLAESLISMAVSLSSEGAPPQGMEVTDDSYVWLRYEAVTAEQPEG